MMSLTPENGGFHDFKAQIITSNPNDCLISQPISIFFSSDYFILSKMGRLR